MTSTGHPEYGLWKVTEKLKQLRQTISLTLTFGEYLKEFGNRYHQKI